MSVMICESLGAGSWTTNLSSVDGSLVHSLDDGRASAEHHQEVKHEGLAPTVSFFMSQPALFLLREDRNVLEAVGSVLHTSHKSTLVPNLALVGEATSFDEVVDILEDLIFGHSAQRVS